VGPPDVVAQLQTEPGNKPVMSDPPVIIIAGTRPLMLLTWSGTHWVLPRAYADMLDRSQEQDRALAERARICTGCRAQGSPWAWRTVTPSGYVTLCPVCSGEAFQPYTGQLDGVAYRSLRRAHRATEYLCCLCRESRAALWEYCHEHGHIRGPLTELTRGFLQVRWPLR
jgi:hypothetical protein